VFLPAAPLDWSLKTTVRFTSPLPFTIAEEAAFLSSSDSVQAQRAFSSSEGVHSLSMQQRYLAALHSWQFPANPWHGPTTGAAKLRAPPPEVLQRRLDWQTAFASLYDTLRCGACDAFYYISPEVSPGWEAGGQAGSEKCALPADKLTPGSLDAQPGSGLHDAHMCCLGSG
jgi:hypothetical protein